jgi:hypothetical protein
MFGYKQKISKLTSLISRVESVEKNQHKGSDQTSERTGGLL